jgi:hypothetical protein
MEGTPMDAEHVDRIATGLGSGASRRRLLRLGSALLPGGLLAAWQREAAGAERPHERLARRTPQRNHQQRTKNNNDNDNDNKKNDNNQNNNNQNNNDGGGSGGGGQLGAVLPGQPGPSSVCLGNCQEAFDGCAEPCDNSVCLGFCQDRLNSCKANCPNA